MDNGTFINIGGLRLKISTIISYQGIKSTFNYRDTYKIKVVTTRSSHFVDCSCEMVMLNWLETMDRMLLKNQKEK